MSSKGSIGVFSQLVYSLCNNTSFFTTNDFYMEHGKPFLRPFRRRKPDAYIKKARSSAWKDLLETEKYSNIHLSSLSDQQIMYDITKCPVYFPAAFGCCPDNAMPALGLKYKGCPGQCESWSVIIGRDSNHGLVCKTTNFLIQRAGWSLQ